MTVLMCSSLPRCGGCVCYTTRCSCETVGVNRHQSFSLMTEPFALCSCRHYSKLPEASDLAERKKKMDIVRTNYLRRKQYAQVRDLVSVKYVQLDVPFTYI